MNANISQYNYGGLNKSNLVRYRYIYSDSHISDFLASVTDKKRIGFLNDWNGDIDLMEYGYPKDDKGLPVFNYSIAYDIDNKAV